MKTKYRMPDESFGAIMEIGRTPSPVMFLSGGTPMGPSTQERANAVWQKMGDDLGFLWGTAEDAGTGDPQDFLATPKAPSAPPVTFP